MKKYVRGDIWVSGLGKSALNVEVRGTIRFQDEYELLDKTELLLFDSIAQIGLTKRLLSCLRIHKGKHGAICWWLDGFRASERNSLAVIQLDVIVLALDYDVLRVGFQFGIELWIVVVNGILKGFLREFK